MVCEFALTGNDREYELRAPADWNPTGLSVERFDDALDGVSAARDDRAPAARRGWLLDDFESERVTLH